MSFSQIAGSAIVPTLSRVVLALAFVTAGYNKVMTESTFSAAEAKVLRDQLGVQMTPADVAAATPLVVPAAYRQDEGGAPPANAGEKKASPPTRPGGGDPPAAVVTPPDAPPQVVPRPVVPAPDATALAGDGATFKAKSLHQITLMCHAQRWPSPTSLAWAAALTELIGGGLILVGFLSRLWGLGLAITMGVAFYLVSMQVYGVLGMSPLVYATDVARFNTTFNQLALFVLAVGVLLTGPGPASVDRLLFGRGKVKEQVVLTPDEPPMSKGRPV